jgi:hypothetical protein
VGAIDDYVFKAEGRVLEEVAERACFSAEEELAEELEVGYYLHLICD